MPLRELHRQVAAIALRAAARHGFALGGGNALIAYGVISRPTQDVDLVTNRETGVGAAAEAVEAALRREGFAAARQDRTSELAGWLNGPRLVETWRDLYLPRGVRQAWEEHHEVLRAAQPADTAA